MGDLSANFSRAEFACHCRCGASHVSDDLVNSLQLLRDSLHEPIKILSGVRCPYHNKRVGGARNSQHLTGNAADIVVDGIETEKLYRYIDDNADVFGFGGLGLYINLGFVHVDVRKEKARWQG